MASVQNRFARDVWAQMSKLLWGRAYRLDVDRVGLERLRELNQRYPLVFLPSHKSNMDGFVMSSVTVRERLPGQPRPRRHQHGLLADRPARPARRRGLHPAQLRRQRGLQVRAARVPRPPRCRKRFNLEWYIEGGRSRTGKLRPPRDGPARTTWPRASRTAGVEEVMLVPVSIVYDQPERGRRDDRRGRAAAKKRPEGTRLAGRLRAQPARRPRAACSVRFGEPLSLREALGRVGEARTRSSKVAFEVCDADQPRDAGDADLARHARAARRRRPRADAGRGAAR